jgi:hypothetical protein
MILKLTMRGQSAVMRFRWSPVHCWFLSSCACVLKRVHGERHLLQKNVFWHNEELCSYSDMGFSNVHLLIMYKSLQKLWNDSIYYMHDSLNVKPDIGYVWSFHNEGVPCGLLYFIRSLVDIYLTWEVGKCKGDMRTTKPDELFISLLLDDLNTFKHTQDFEYPPPPCAWK